MKPKKIDSVKWEEMSPFIERDIIGIRDPYYIFSLPIIGCYSPKTSNKFVVKGYGKLAACFEVNPDLSSNELGYEAKICIKALKRQFEELQKKKMFEYVDELDERLVRKRINYILPISRKEFYKLGKRDF